jgi:hypothetical protein
MMNNKIEELAEQCGFRSNPNVYDRNQSFDIEKFTELLIRECADLVDNNDDSYPYVSFGDMIKKHFGVDIDE